MNYLMFKTVTLHADDCPFQFVSMWMPPALMTSKLCPVKAVQAVLA